MNKLIQAIQLADKYSRLKEDGSKETWPEVVERVIGFLSGELSKQNREVPSKWWDLIREGMLKMDVLPSMRVVQMAGPALERDHVGAYNCAYLALDTPESLAELLYIMMQGTGVGFSVERCYTEQWPPVPQDWVHNGQNHVNRRATWIVEDSTDGWVDAYRHGINTWMEGFDLDFDYSRIRPSGSPLKTKGGFASGPEPFKYLMDQTRAIILGAAGRKLTPFEVHRLATMAGSIVMVGGVRRAAQISLSDHIEREMRLAKVGQFWHTYPELSMANNSAVLESVEQLETEWASLRASGTGERGLFNPHGPIPARRERRAFGTNPCGEILLRSRQFCNLSIAVARPTDTVQTLYDKVYVATMLGTIQSCLTHFPGLPKEWRINCEEERLLGVDITGTMDCPLLQQANEETGELLRNLRNTTIQWNQYFARQLGIPESRAITCNKPSGNSSQLLDSSSGIHPRYAPYYIRRLRIGRDTPLARKLQEIGVPVHPEVGSTSLADALVWVFEVPAASPMGARTRVDLTALDQLEYWLMWKQEWTEHNPSCTIYVEEHEWDQVFEWVKEHWQLVGGLSFLPKSNHVYELAPYEEITEEQYVVLSERIRWNGESLTKWAGSEAGSTDAACAGDFCEF